MASIDKFAHRLTLGSFNRKDCLAAIRGQAVPYALGHPAHQLCTIRGIRYHAGFAEELRGVLPAFTRALNARSIMSNSIPTSLDDMPYCIWHPETASEETYRSLALGHPHMAYQIGRACAVAGYTGLYRELQLLPETHIAEEARECGNLDIFELIKSEHTRYSIMNDYERRLDEPKLASLNGDTAVRWMLDIKQALEDSCDYIVKERRLDQWFESRGFQVNVFDITEDMNIDEHKSERTHLLSTRLEVQLLSEPLPIDLPTVQKDVLITMAAYQGNLERYVRLRRPKMVHGERFSCIRGIYHNTFFANWWSKANPDHELSAAINARMIMNNMLAGAPYQHVPYLIWWPTLARETTYRELARLQPSMQRQIVHACIVAGYRDLFDDLLPDVKFERAFLIAAEEQADTHFRNALEPLKDSLEPAYVKGWEMRISNVMRPGPPQISKYLDLYDNSYAYTGPYNGRDCKMSVIELASCLPDAWQVPADATRDTCRTLDYQGWPYGARPESDSEDDSALGCDE